MVRGADLATRTLEFDRQIGSDRASRILDPSSDLRGVRGTTT
jgi:hypothetical protein